MATSLYYKEVNGEYKKIDTGGAGGGVGEVTVTSLVSTGRKAPIAAGEAFTVPTHAPDSDALQIFLNGLLCAKGREYVEASATSVTFTEVIPADWEITATVTASADGALLSETAVSESRSAVLSAGTAFTVPSHTVGLGKIKVFLDGLLCQAGVHFFDLGETEISFSADIPPTMQIVVNVLKVK